MPGLRYVGILSVIRYYLVPRDPFQSIDVDGVGGLMRTAVEKGRRARPDLKLGICGEHGGDPDPVKFCHRLGLTHMRRCT